MEDDVPPNPLLAELKAIEVRADSEESRRIQEEQWLSRVRKEAEEARPNADTLEALANVEAYGLAGVPADPVAALRHAVKLSDSKKESDHKRMFSFVEDWAIDCPDEAEEAVQFMVKERPDVIPSLARAIMNDTLEDEGLSLLQQALANPATEYMAACELADVYFHWNGEMDATEEKLAFQYLSRALDLQPRNEPYFRDSTLRRDLAACYAEGWGTKVDLKKALEIASHPRS